MYYSIKSKLGQKRDVSMTLDNWLSRLKSRQWCYIRNRKWGNRSKIVLNFYTSGRCYCKYINQHEHREKHICLNYSMLQKDGIWKNNRPLYSRWKSFPRVTLQCLRPSNIAHLMSVLNVQASEYLMLSGQHLQNGNRRTYRRGSSGDLSTAGGHI